MVPNNVQPCPCCSKPLSGQQISRHLARLRCWLEQNIVALDDNANLALDNVDLAPDGIALALNDINIDIKPVDAIEMDKDKDQSEQEGKQEGEDSQGTQTHQDHLLHYKLTYKVPILRVCGRCSRCKPGRQ